MEPGSRLIYIMATAIFRFLLNCSNNGITETSVTISPRWFSPSAGGMVGVAQAGLIWNFYGERPTLKDCRGCAWLVRWNTLRILKRAVLSGIDTSASFIFKTTAGPILPRPGPRKATARVKLPCAKRSCGEWLPRTLKGFDFGPATLDAAWKTVLLHQFHDALPGSSIHRVYQEIEHDHEVVLSQARDLAVRAASSLVRVGAAGGAAFNSLSWPRTTLVELPQGRSPGWSSPTGGRQNPG